MPIKEGPKEGLHRTDFHYNQKNTAKKDSYHNHTQTDSPGMEFDTSITNDKNFHFFGMRYL